MVPNKMILALYIILLVANAVLATLKTDAKDNDLVEVMTKGGKTEITNIDIEQAKAILEGTNSRHRRASVQQDSSISIPTAGAQSRSYFNGSISLKNNCGKSSVPNRIPTKLSSTRIVGGIEVRPNSMPWIVSIQIGGSHYCGGSLIRCSEKDESRLILTAAHCLAGGLQPKDLTVSLGDHDLTRQIQGEEKKGVSNFEINKNYNPDTSANDIAVIQLSQPVLFSKIIQPVCLPDASDNIPQVGAQCIVAGWGVTSEGGYSTSNILMQVVSPIMNDTVCIKNYQNIGINIQPDKMLCAGYPEGKKDSCQGDSGGPYVCYYNDIATQFGVVSFGEGCARANFPGVYARVPHYRNWIDEMRSKYCK